jgi:prepilin signal peptidase PulO-like enzyme (type II secretory pathway)
MYFFSAFDIKRGIIPNKFIFPIIGIVFFGRVGQFLFGYTNVRQLFSCLLGGLIYFAIFGLINLLTTKGLFPGVKKGRRGFGWGDAKYGLFLGLILGVRQTVLSFWIAVFVGAVYGVIVKTFSKGKTNKIPFAPFMSIGVLVSFTVGSYLLQYFKDNILMLSL